MSLFKKVNFILILWVTVIACHHLVMPIKSKREDAARAAKHFAKVLKDVKCSQPFPRVVKMSDLIGNSRKTFLPRCTLLHYCGEDTGCCQQENQRCVALKSEEVSLYFWVMEMTDSGPRKGIEKVVLTNDTECHCQVWNHTTSVKNDNHHHFRKDLSSRGNEPNTLHSLSPGYSSSWSSSRSSFHSQSHPYSTNGYSRTDIVKNPPYVVHSMDTSPQESGSAKNPPQEDHFKRETSVTNPS